MIFDAVFFILIGVIFYRSLRKSNSITLDSSVIAISSSANEQAKLLDYANRLFKEKKFLASEKAFLRVLKINHRNTSAYQKLGAIYVMQKNYADAIECFQIVAQLTPAASHYQQLGMVYMDNGNVIKAIAALEKAIMFEPSAARYLALAKIHAKLSNNLKSVAMLEKAAELDSRSYVLRILLEGYISTKDKAKADALRQKMSEQGQEGQLVSKY